MSVITERESAAAQLLDYWTHHLPGKANHVELGGEPRVADVVAESGSEDGFEEGEVPAANPSARVRPDRPEPEVRGSLISGSDAGTLRPLEQRVDRCAQPGWATGKECVPKVGDQVYCTAGLATVLRLLGKTSNGSRLLELRLPGKRRDSFFAAGSNVLIAPQDTPPAAVPVIPQPQVPGAEATVG